MNIRDCDLLRAELSEAALLCGLNEPPWAWALFGSAVLQLHGLRDSISDVDVAVDYRVFEKLAGRLAYSFHLPHPAHPPYLSRRVGGGDAHIFYRWRDDEPLIDLVQCRWDAELLGSGVDVWPAAPLELVRVHKIACREYHGVEGRWAKHMVDLDNLDRHLGRTL